MGLGIQTSALSVGGYTTTLTGVTEEWTGASWTEVADLNTARSGSGSGGTTAAGLVFGGETPPATAATEEWNNPSNVIQTITTS